MSAVEKGVMMVPTRNPLRISFQAWIALLALGLSLWFLMSYGRLIANISGLLFAAFLFSLAIRPIVDFAGRWRIPRAITTLLAYLVVIGLLVGLGKVIVPVIGSEISALRAAGPDLAKQIASVVNSSPWLGQFLPTTDQLGQNLSQRLDMLIVTVFHTATDIGSIALDALLIVILAFFFTTDEEMTSGLVKGLAPAGQRKRVRRVLTTIHTRLTYWIWAQIAIGAYFAITFSVGLKVIGIPFAFSIGLVGGFIEVVPYLGGAVALFLSGASALTVDPTRLIWVILYYLVVVEIEAHILGPLLYGRVTGLHPALVLVALIAGLKMWGVVGVLFAVPIAVILVVIVSEMQSDSTDETNHPEILDNNNSDSKSH